MREAVLIKQSNIEDMLRFLETTINVTVATLDRTSQKEINKLNTLLQDYKALLFADSPRILRDKNGDIADLEKQISKFRKAFSNKTISASVGKKVKGEFTASDVKSIYNKVIEDK